MPLYRLVYCSTVRHHQRFEVESILSEARAKNFERGVTGILFFNNSYCLQVLEGRRNTVTDLFVTIACDPRHEQVSLLSVEPLARREFAGWTMNYITWTDRDMLIARRYSEGAEFAPHDWSLDAINGFVSEQAMARVQPA